MKIFNKKENITTKGLSNFNKYNTVFQLKLKITDR